MNKSFSKTILIVLIIFYAASAKAQPDFIDTDRPDQTESAFLVPVNWLQLEAGFNFQKNNSEEKEFLVPVLLSKYGLTKRIELRLITAIKTTAAKSIPFGKSAESGFDVAELGAKISLFEEKRLLPKTSFIFHAGFPAFASVKFKPDKIAPNFRFTMQHTISSKISLGYNLGCEWDGFTNDPAYIHTLTLGYSPSNKWYTYIEEFGGFKKGVLPELNLDGGITYYTSQNTKVDISSGLGITNAAPEWYIAIGFSFRCSLKKNR